MVDAVDTCKVGYLPKDFCGEADYLDNECIRVDDVYTENDGDIERCIKFYHSYGYAKGTVLSDQTYDAGQSN